MKFLVEHFNYIPTLITKKEHFEFWEKHGYHIIPANFYSPIPRITDFDESSWNEKIPLSKVSINHGLQLKILQELVLNYKSEYDEFPIQKKNNISYYIMNGNFTTVDGEVYFSLIRKYKPKKIIEIGSGYSTLLAVEAIRKNERLDDQGTNLTCIEPYPRDFFLNFVNNEGINLIKKKIQDINVAFFDQLGKDDFLFIDSSHVMKMNSDVQYEIFNILPVLKPGVIIHFHDIFIPAHYPKHFLKDKLYFWNEQYLLIAFLMHNDSYEILWSSSYMHLTEPQELKKAFNSYNPEIEHPGSFWFKKIK